MIILLAITDSSHQLARFDVITSRFPVVARQASMQVMDPGSQLLSGVSVDSLILTKIGMYRMVEPRMVGDVSDAYNIVKRHKYGATIVMGSEEVYRAFLPFADRIVHISLEEPFPDVFNGSMGEFLDMTQPKYRIAWGEGEARTYGIHSVGQPDFVQIDYTTTGKSHFELESPPGNVERRAPSAPYVDLLGARN